MSKHRESALSGMPDELIEGRIFSFRGQKVMIDSDLAELYEVPTHRLNEQVTRNLDRFPDDFMFQLSREETHSLRSQNAILKGRGQHRKHLPRAFTEHGILMLSSVLRSERAVQVNIAIMRAFIRLRRTIVKGSLRSHSRVYNASNQVDRAYRL